MDEVNVKKVPLFNKLIVVPIRRTFQTVSYVIPIFKNVKNWGDYYKDIFGLHNDNYWVMRLEDLKIKLRSGTVDRWSALENLVLEKNKLESLNNKKFDVIIDLGANIGASVLDFHRYFPLAKIIAIEPNPKNIELLRENTTLNKLDEQVLIIEAAVSDKKSSSTRLFMNENNADSSTVRKKKGEVVSVDNLHFNALAKYIKGSTLLKIDIEGQEYSLFKKEYLDLIKKFKFLIVETHYVSEKINRETLEKFLRNYRFKYSKKGRFYFIDCE